MALSLSDDIAPEVSMDQKERAKRILDQVFGAEDSGTWDKRRDDARAATSRGGENPTNHRNADQDTAMALENIPDHELVYGELGVDALVTILDAIGVQRGDVFLDIGSGDGILVAGAALLYSSHLKASRGVEIVPKLYDRSLEFKSQLMEKIFQENNDGKEEISPWKSDSFPEVSFASGNIYESMPPKGSKNNPEGFDISETTIAVCFATTWSKNIPGKRLDRLSRALGREGTSELPIGARVVVIDGVLDHRNDGFRYDGELKLFCPDTAPYSIARLYSRI